MCCERRFHVMADFVVVEAADLPFAATGYTVLIPDASGTVTVDGEDIPVVAGMPVYLLMDSISAFATVTAVTVGVMKSILTPAVGGLPVQP